MSDLLSTIPKVHLEAMDMYTIRLVKAAKLLWILMGEYGITTMELVPRDMKSKFVLTMNERGDQKDEKAGTNPWDAIAYLFPDGDSECPNNKAG